MLIGTRLPFFCWGKPFLDRCLYFDKLETEPVGKEVTLLDSPAGATSSGHSGPATEIPSEANILKGI